MGEIRGMEKAITNGLVFYINAGDRACFVSGSFSGRQLVGSLETLNFQNQLFFYNQFGGYWGVSSPNRGINGSGSLAFSSAITLPNQYTHIMVHRKNDINYESQGWFSAVLSSGRGTALGVSSTSPFLTNTNTTLISTTSITNNTDWFFTAGKNELVGSAWTQSLFVRGFNAGTRVYETRTQNLSDINWVGGSGSWTGVSIGSSLLYDAGLGLYMIYNRALSSTEINTVYDSIKFRFNLPLQ
jgi:hypothetical protein